MARDILFRKLCTPETLRLGWHLAQADSRDDFFRDPVGYADFAASLEQRIRYLLPDLKAGRFRPRHLIDVDVPKSGLSVRPGNVLPIAEAMVIHAVVYLLAPKLDKKLSSQVFSYRLVEDWKKRAKKGERIFREADREIPFLKGRTIRKFDPFEAWYQAWPEFDAARKKAVAQEGYTHLTRTDITAYFENVDLRILENLLREYIRSEPQLIRLLMRILEAWTRRTSVGTPVGRGIPQGNDASSFLANLHLMPLDRALSEFCKRHDATWFRYVDDVEVYTRSERAARDVVLVINESLRQLHLNLQGSKTEILSGDDLLEEHSDADQQILDRTWTELQKLDCRDRSNAKEVTALLKALRPLAARYRRGLPESVQKLAKSENRTARRLMTCYGRAGRPYMKDVALACLRELPELRMLDKTLTYLGQLDYSLHEEVAQQLVDLLESDTFPLPYQAARVIEQIGVMHPENPKPLSSRIRKYALARKREWTVRQKAGEMLAAYPYREDHAASVSSQLLDDDEPWVRRAGLVLLTRGPVAIVRERMHDAIYSPDPAVGQLALFYERHLGDEDFARSQLAAIRKGNQSDFGLSKRAPQWWLLSCHPSPDFVKELRAYIKSLETRSARLGWHRQALLKRTQWVEKLGDT